MKDLKSLADEAKHNVGSGVVAIAGRERGRQGEHRRRGHPRSHRPLQRRRSRAPRPAALGGKGGGGRPDMAQAGGPDGAKTREALAAVEAGVRRAAGA